MTKNSNLAKIWKPLNRYLLIGLIFSLFFILTSCGSEQASSSTNSPTSNIAIQPKSDKDLPPDFVDVMQMYNEANKNATPKPIPTPTVDKVKPNIYVNENDSGIKELKKMIVHLYDSSISPTPTPTPTPVVKTDPSATSTPTPSPTPTPTIDDIVKAKEVVKVKESKTIKDVVKYLKTYLESMDITDLSSQDELKLERKAKQKIEQLKFLGKEIKNNLITDENIAVRIDEIMEISDSLSEKDIEKYMKK